MPTPRFIDRTRELALLDDRWRSKQAELVVLYGRRRIGKTHLLRHFSESVRSVYHAAARLPEAQQLREIGALVGDTLGDDLLRENGFASWEQLFRILAQVEERLVLVLDEYPYLVEGSPGLSSQLQRAWDQSLARSRLMLVLCGSSIGMMEQEILAGSAPLFGRRTAQLRLTALTAADAAGFVPEWGDSDVVQAFTVLGGVPHYLAMLDPAKSLASNLRRILIGLGAPLRDEVEFLLRQELTEPRVYLGVLTAIASGSRKLSEIANATGVVSTSLTRYLAVLQQLGLVEREVPVTETRPEKSKKGLFRILDPFLAFWLRHVLPHRALLESGREHEAVNAVMAAIDLAAPATYEEICRDLVRRGLLDDATGRCWTRVGRWWDRTGEIDLLGFASEGEEILVGEAKWSVRPVGVDVVAHLEKVAGELPGDLAARPRHLVLFSRSGFTAAVRTAADRRGDLHLVEGLRLVPPR